MSQFRRNEREAAGPQANVDVVPLTGLAAWCILVVMTDEPRDEEEYEPADIDPDNPIASVPDGGPPVEADPADWADQHRVVPADPADDERGLDDE